MQTTLILQKMSNEYHDPIRYFLQSDHGKLALNEFIGKTVHIKFNGHISCIRCGRNIKKTYAQGYCYPCFREAPETSECIFNPELCQAHQGKGRDPAWEEAHHNVPHVVYLALSSKLKVGVTRKTQIPARWVDQGASQAVVIATTPYRHIAGVIEVALKPIFGDKTPWQGMLKNHIADHIDLFKARNQGIAAIPAALTPHISHSEPLYKLNYPVMEYPQKVNSIKLDKLREIKAKLCGIKGQYLLFEHGQVFNVRSHTAYHVQLSI